MGVDAVTPDWMHTKHLGVDQYLFGSVLMMMVSEVDGNRMMGRRSQEDNVAELWEELKELHRSMSLNDGYSELRLSMFSPSSAEQFPCLKGKAAEALALGRPLLKAFENRMDVANKHHRLVRLALQSSVELEVILARTKDKFRLTGADAEQFRSHCFRYAQCVSALGTYYHGKVIWLFHFTAKMH